MNELEKYCFNELIGLDENTFIFKLHERNYFDINKFVKLISSIDELYNFYEKNGKTIFYKSLTTKINKTLPYIISCFYYHENEHDQFKIKNFNEIENNVNDIFEIIKIILGRIII